MAIEWVNKGLVIFYIHGRSVHVEGELSLHRDPDFVIYPGTMTHWDDGGEISEDEREEILDQLITEAWMRGWRFELA